MLPVIALVGRPNVGKSTLFNVLTRSRDALVADLPGLTRDRQYGHGKYHQRTFIVIDTGGLSGETQELDARMAQQTMLAVEESDPVLFIVDARDGMTPVDQEVAAQLRRLGKKIHLVVNKAEGLSASDVMTEFSALGFSAINIISAAHAQGIPQLLDDVFAVLPEWEIPEGETADGHIKVAVVGKPNVGKSTLVNRILGEERVVVMDMPGTTRDSIHIPFEHHGQLYTLIDTAGIRRKKSVSDAVEKFSIIKTLQAVDEAHVVVLLIDAHEGVSDQDLHLLGYVVDAGRALVVAINKWDGLDDYQRQQVRNGIEQRLEFVRFAELFFISALHGSNVGLLYKAIDSAYASASRKMATPELTRILEKAVSQHQPPLIGGRRIKLRYAHQGGHNPPLIIIHGNQTELVPASYKRYLINKFMDVLDIRGTPLRLEFKTGANPFAGRKKDPLSDRQIRRKKRLVRHVKKSGKGR
ncbi:MAG: GTPase [Pseudomonadota bacterium]|nr:GTPase [Pseudomonadota bacterium]